ncbi:AAA family ATPase [Candidatus Woesearchaeota archaeon]|nr:AAA family ATPase [Candidatus Woesearchaeota archaeon]
MGLFTFRHSERDSELEKALQGVPFGGDIKFSYSGRGKEKDKETTSPVYLLPVDANNGIVYGYFTIDGKLAEVPIGFLRKNNFLSKEHFRPALDGSMVKENGPVESVLYLPLKLTDLVSAIGVETEGKFVPREGSPFSLFGVEGTQGSYPLIFVSETEEMIICKGLYKSKDGQLLSYNHKGMRHADKPIRDFLRELRCVKTVASPKKVLGETAQIGTGKAPEPAKSLETLANGEINWEEPKSIVSYLDQYVVGQEDAKMIISVAFSNYMTKVRTQNDELQKDNMLLIGPSGVGKTYMVSLLAKRASLPMVQTKLTGKSTEGYKGENLSTVFEQMRAMTTGEAPYGVIFFDEIDKLANDEGGSGSGFGPRLQDEIIGWVEEATVLADRKDEKKEYNGLNTRNILFVTAGAFQSTDKDSSLAGIIRKRLGKGQKQMGFGVQQKPHDDAEEYVIPKVRPEDLIAYGLRPELVGRLPSLGVLRPLTVDDKVRILTGTKRSSITNYTQLLLSKGYQVEIDSAVPEVIAKYCPEETGARALNAVCNDLFTEIMFDPQRYADDKKVIRVTPDLARKLINLYA